MRLTSLVGVALATACGVRAVPSNISAARPPGPAAVAGPSAARPAPPPAASASSPSAPPPPERRVGPFYVVATGVQGEPLMPARLGDKLFIRNWTHLVEVRGDELVPADALLDGLPGLAEGESGLQQLVGYWPHATFASVNHYTEDHACSSTTIHRWRDGGWEPVPMSRPGDLVPLFAAAEDGRIVAVKDPPSNELTFPVPGKWGTVPDLEIETGGFQTQVIRLLIAPDDTLFVLVWEIGEDGLIVAHVDPRHPEAPRFSPITCPERSGALRMHGLLVGGDRKVHAYGATRAAPKTGAWATFDGKLWHCQELPNISSVIRLQVDPHGSPTLIAGESDSNTVWYRSAAADWRRVSLPRGVDGDELGEFSPAELVVLPGEDVWILGSFASNTAILHNRPIQSVFHFPEVRTF
jgi:hypothetical protein